MPTVQGWRKIPNFLKLYWPVLCAASVSSRDLLLGEQTRDPSITLLSASKTQPVMLVRPPWSLLPLVLLGLRMPALIVAVVWFCP